MAQATGTANQTAPTGFDDRAAAVVGRLKVALANMIAAVPGRVERASDLQRRLGIPSTVSWQIFRVAHDANPVTAGAYVPKAKAMRGVLSAASKHGVPEPLVVMVAEAFEAFEAFVDDAAGDRESFGIIASDAMPEEEAELINLPQRRALFRANAHVLGVHAKTSFVCSLLHPTADGRHMDFAALHGYVGMRRFRRDATRIIAAARLSDDDETVAVEPLDDLTSLAGGWSLLTRFSTQPFPPLQTGVAPDGFTETELVSDAVGNASTVTYAVGGIVRNARRYCREPGEMQMSRHAITLKPVEIMVHDVLVHENLFGPLKPKSFVCHGALHSGFRLSAHPLPLRTTVLRLGKGPDVMHTRDVPRYTEMVRWACSRAGWDPDRFDVYRCRVEYPVSPSTLVVQFPLPEAPE